MELLDVSVLLKKYTDLKTNLKSEVKQIIVDLKPILKQKNEDKLKRDQEKHFFYAEVPVSKSIIDDYDQVTPTIDELLKDIFITEDEKLAFKKLKKAKENEALCNIYNLAKVKYLKQTSRDVKSLPFNMERYINIEISTMLINKQWSIIKDTIDRDRTMYLNKVRQFEDAKYAFSLFVNFINEKVKNIRNDMNMERANTKKQIAEKDMYSRDYDKTENEVLDLMKDIMIPEGCYTILTSLSPPEWKKKFNLDKLKYNFVETDSDLIDTNKSGCMDNPVYQKPLEEFSIDIQAEPVLEMYWESEHQFSKYLTRLDTKTRNYMLVFHMMKTSKPKHNDIPKRSMWNIRDKIKKLLNQPTNVKFEYIKSIISNETMCNIKSISIDIYKELNYRFESDLIQPYIAIKLLCDDLYEVFKQADEIPAKAWRNTEYILNVINSTRKKERELIKQKFEVVKTTQREAEKMYRMPLPNTRKQKILPCRMYLHKQKPPKKPKKPILHDDQYMYLKCYTYLSREDITDVDIPSVPRLNKNHKNFLKIL